MMYRQRRRVARAAWVLVLALATQLAFAGQLCAAVMLDSALRDTPVRAQTEAADGAVATAESQPCCRAADMAPTTCFTAAGAASLATLAPGSTPLPDVTPFSSIWTARPVAPRLSAAFDAAFVRPPPPAYILLHRFLS